MSYVNSFNKIALFSQFKIYCQTVNANYEKRLIVMAKKINYYLTGASHVVTPDMVENNNKAIPREVANAVKAIAKATKNSENALYTVAYFLNVLNTKNKHGEKPLEKMFKSDTIYFIKTLLFISLFSSIKTGILYFLKTALTSDA